MTIEENLLILNHLTALQLGFWIGAVILFLFLYKTKP